MEPDELFRKYKAVLIRIAGRRALFDITLDSIGKSLFHKKWLGVYSQKDALFKPGYQVLNTSNRAPGTHWVSLFIEGKTVYIYDSFGRPTKSLLKGFYSKAKAKGFSVQDSDYDAEQRGDSEVCGVLALSWLLVIKNLGITAALRI